MKRFIRRNAGAKGRNSVIPHIFDLNSNDYGPNIISCHISYEIIIYESYKIIHIICKASF